MHICICVCAKPTLGGAWVGLSTSRPLDRPTIQPSSYPTLWSFLSCLAMVAWKIVIHPAPRLIWHLPSGPNHSSSHEEPELLGCKVKLVGPVSRFLEASRIPPLRTNRRLFWLPKGLGDTCTSCRGHANLLSCKWWNDLSTLLDLYLGNPWYTSQLCSSCTDSLNRRSTKQNTIETTCMGMSADMNVSHSS